MALNLLSDLLTFLKISVRFLLERFFLNIELKLSLDMFQLIKYSDSKVQHERSSINEVYCQIENPEVFE